MIVSTCKLPSQSVSGDMCGCTAGLVRRGWTKERLCALLTNSYHFIRMTPDAVDDAEVGVVIDFDDLPRWVQRN